MKTWSREYQKKGVEIDYTISASGDGIAKMTEGQNDFGCTDAPMTEEELTNAGGADAVVHIPLVMGAVVPIYNLDGIKGRLRFNGTVLADIYLGKITKWNDSALVKLNPDAGLPDLAITVVARADPSGTSYIFTDYLSGNSPEWKSKVGKLTKPNWPVGQFGPKNPGVAKLVGDIKGALGYVELLYALDKPDLSVGVVRNADDTAWITPSLESVTAAAAGLDNIPLDLRFSFVNAKGKDSYPISGTTWAVLKVKQPPEKAKPLADFLHWLTHEGQDLVAELHYSRLPARVVDMVDKKIERIRAGK
jgi:phosphate transport system substrate-binding protein